jgi:Iron-containing redox enzyme
MMTVTMNSRLKEKLLFETTPFHEVVKEMIVEKNLYSYFINNPDHREILLSRTRQLAEDFKKKNPQAIYSLHRSLGWIYELHLYTPGKHPVYNQFNPILLEVQRLLEMAWEEFEDQRIPKVDYPENPDEFIRWFKLMLINHEVAEHKLFHYLEKNASFEEMAYFFSQEITVDSRFDDLVALAQIGLDNDVKMELAENYWDEMGNGDMSKVHTIMFDHLLEELKVTGDKSLNSLFNDASWESLACGNVLLHSVIHRKNAYRALGALGAVEMLAPKRFSYLVKGYKRIGLSEKAQEYHVLHISIDAKHGDGWLRNAIAPVIKRNPEAKKEIIKGAYYRLNTSMDYCNMLYQTFTKN